jgi:hypothetical protein
MAFAAVVKGIKFSLERQHTVDAAAVFVPRGVAFGLEDDALPIPVVEVGRCGEGGGAFAFAGVENIQRLVRAATSAGGIDGDAEE